ncbi:basic proline-rich protein-like [Pectinophora gossypiella]|uniref:basic proline-rich protein-like n=1 Tax=Pectinophora gossypiella TaxID=13191 RepID=UPI00214EEB66|nr:basic proline-rich protein-like [Pectinophora gossypiella]
MGESRAVATRVVRPHLEGCGRGPRDATRPTGGPSEHSAHTPAWRCPARCAAWRAWRCPAPPPPPAPPPGRPRSSCTPSPRPACAPCEPAPRPACRARPPERVRALRVTCCPPPRGLRPPCAAPQPACSRSCQHARPPSAAPPRVDATPDDAFCGDGQDRVARRLLEAENLRRMNYLLEVAETEPAPPPSPPRYRLPGERECMCATDGRQYTLAPAPKPTASRACGPCREPPPPRCVEVLPDNECQVRKGRALDPCAHRPRVIVDVERPKAREPPGRSQCAPPGQKKAGDPSAPRPCPPPAPGAARRVGDSSWCTTLRPPAAAAPRCRPPDAAERLKRRACRPPPHARSLHTTPAPAARSGPDCAPRDLATVAAETKANAEKLSGVLKERSRLKEAAHGREVPPEAGGGASSVSGALRLHSPGGGSSVRVHVTLDGAQPAAPPPRGPEPRPAPRPGPHPGLRSAPLDVPDPAPKATCKDVKPPPKLRSPCVNRAVSPFSLERHESWLSLKNIQEKIAITCGKIALAKKCTPDKAGGGGKPAGPPRPRAPPPRPCAAPCGPRPTPCTPRPAPPQPDKKKPTCNTSISTPIPII